MQQHGVAFGYYPPARVRDAALGYHTPARVASALESGIVPGLDWPRRGPGIVAPGAGCCIGYDPPARVADAHNSQFDQWKSPPKKSTSRSACL